MKRAPLAFISVASSLGWLTLLLLFGLSFAVVFTGALLLTVLGCLASYRFSPQTRTGRLLAYGRRALYALSLVWLLSLLLVMCLLFAPQPQVTPQQHTHVLILGAGLRNGSELSQILLARLQTALPLLRDNAHLVAVVSGGQGADESLSEALAMRNWLLQQGIAPTRILMEDRSTSTEENLMFSRALLPARSRVLLLTSNFHLYRSLRLARQLRLPVTAGMGAPTPPTVLLNYSLREYFALTRDFLLPPA